MRYRIVGLIGVIIGTLYGAGAAGAAGEVADLKMTVFHDDDTGDTGVDPYPAVGSHFDYFARALNYGDPAEGTTITVTASSGLRLDVTSSPECASNSTHNVLTCSYGTVGELAYASAHFRVTYSSTGPKTLSVQAASTTPDAQPSDNKVGLGFVVGSYGPDLAVLNYRASGFFDPTLDPDPIAGSAYYYVAAPKNNSTDERQVARDVTLTITANTAGLALTSPDCAHNAASTVLTCTTSVLQPGAAVYWAWGVSYRTSGPKTITMQIASATAEQNVANNKRVLNFTVRTTSADLRTGYTRDDPQFTRAPDPDPVAGLGYNYLAEFVNFGPEVAYGASLTITASAGLALSSSEAACSANAAQTVLTCRPTESPVPAGFGTSWWWHVEYLTAGAKTITLQINAPVTDDFATQNNKAVISFATRKTSADLIVRYEQAAAPNAAAPDPAPKVGSGFTYNTVLSNSGPEFTYDVNVTITASAGLRLSEQGDLCSGNPAGTVLTCTTPGRAMPRGAIAWQWHVDYLTAGAKTITIQANAPLTIDPNTANNKSVLSFTVRALRADLAVSTLKAVDSRRPAPGQTKPYFLQVNNLGLDTASNVTVTITANTAGQRLIPTGSCTVNTAQTVITCKTANLFVNHPVAFDYSVAYTTAGSKTVTAKVTAVTPADPVTANNSKPLVTKVGVGPDVAIVELTDLDTSSHIIPGDMHQFRFVSTNNGPDNAASATLKITATAGVRLIVQDSACFTTGATTMTCGLGAPPADPLDEQTLYFDVEYLTTGSKTITATISVSPADPDTTNNTKKVVQTVVAPKADLKVTQSGDAVANTVGSTHHRAIFVTNLGPDYVGAVTLTVTVNTGQVLDFSASGYSCTTAFNSTSGQTIVTCALGALQPPVEGNEVQIDFTVRYTAAGTRTLSAKATGNVADPVAANNTSTVSTSVVAGP